MNSIRRPPSRRAAGLARDGALRVPSCRPDLARQRMSLGVARHSPHGAPPGQGARTDRLFATLELRLPAGRTRIEPAAAPRSVFQSLAHQTTFASTLTGHGKSDGATAAIAATTVETQRRRSGYAGDPAQPGSATERSKTSDRRITQSRRSSGGFGERLLLAPCSASPTPSQRTYFI